MREGFLEEKRFDLGLERWREFASRQRWNGLPQKVMSFPSLRWYKSWADGALAEMLLRRLNSRLRPPQEVRHRITIRPSNSTPEYILKN